MGNCQKDQSDEQPVGDGRGPVSEIRITNYIWNKDYQGLFDYDSKTIEKKTFKVKGNAIISKYAGKYQLLTDDVKSLTQPQLKNALFRIGQKDNFYQVNPIFLQSENYTLQKLLWLVVSSLPQKNHTLQQRDILKLGKQKMRVREIAHVDSNPSMNLDNYKLSKTVYEDLTNKNNNQQKSHLKPDEKQVKQNHSEVTTSDQVCRICLDPGEYENPLITPCKCSGSVKYIHLNCLKSWLAKRLNAVKGNHCITINWQPLSCQMCKAAFKYRIYMDGKKFYTVDIPKPPKPYIIVQLMRKNTATKGKVFHFISFAEKNKITLGRRKDIDVRISEDISISRAHAIIQYNPDLKQFKLFDNKSKFGTLILIKKGIMVRPKLPAMSFQVGAEVFSFQSLRGSGNQNFIADQGNINEYMLDHLSDEEDQDIEEENDENDSESQNPVEDEAQSPDSRLPHRVSLPQVQ